MPALFLEKLRNNKDAQILMVNTRAGISVAGFKQEDFQLAGAAQFGNPFEQYLEEQNARLQVGGAAFQEFLGGQSFEIPNLKNQRQSLHQYISSQRPQINVNLTIIRFDMAHPSTTSVTKDIIAATFPDADSEEALVTSPGGYKPGTREGTWTVQVGTYFRADQLLLINATNIESKEVVSDGSPLYVQLNCVFEPIMTPTAKQVRGWYLK